MSWVAIARRGVGLWLWTVLMLSGATAHSAELPGGPAEKPSGTGVIVHPEGYILTAYHVVANARRIMVVTAGEFRAPAVVVSADPDHDLVLLKIETVGLSEALLGYAGAVRLDQEVIVVGFPFGLREVSVTRGRIAAVRTKGVRRVFQVDAAINPGSSGGPVFNRLGELVGIVTTKFSHPSGIVPEGMGFAVPISYATPLLANIPDFDFAAIGKGRKGSGVEPDGLVRELARTTVRIETLRFQEPTTARAAPPASPASPGAAEAAKSPTNQPPPESRRTAGVLAQPSKTQEEGIASDEEQSRIAKVNEQLVAAQQEEFQRLAQRDIRMPEAMVLVPAGDFLMGAEDGLPDARPQRRVFVSSYWIDRYEVTNAEYRQCVQSGACQVPKDQTSFDDPQHAQHPVTNVTWAQARAYCQWRGRRLPTEAEWEKAARGTDGRRYPWGNSEDGIKRLKESQARASTNGTVQVGSQAEQLSPYGVYDVVGSVWEWVKDWYAEDYYAGAPSRDPQGPLRGSFRVFRGGDASQGPLELRVSYRGWDEMTYWGPTLGFRCAMDTP
jgi:formylglycine-generating enzyme required for sulfatase activity